MRHAGNSDLWVRATSIPELRAGDLQIWRLDLHGPDGSALLARAFEALTGEERQRAAKMRTGTAPEEFIAGRGLLRRLLSAALDCDPRQVGIVIGPHRKPALRPIRGLTVPHFNVSHSRGMVLIALSQAGPVGVDVEYLDPTVEVIDVAQGAFHPHDLEQIESAGTQQEKLLAFYACWTRREAVAKADGRGLTLPASGFSTGTYTSGEQMVEVGLDDTVHSASQYSSRHFVQNIEVGPCHLAGVAVARPRTRLSQFDFTCLPTEQSNRGLTLTSTSLLSSLLERSNISNITFSTAKPNLLGD